VLKLIWKKARTIKMDIDRNVLQGEPSAIERVNFCLDKLEEQGFIEGISWETQITERLTLEEMIGALVSAEQELKLLEWET
jgi:hypothetical protein